MRCQTRSWSRSSHGQHLTATNTLLSPENVRNERLMVCWVKPGDDKEDEEVEDEQQALATPLIVILNRCRYNMHRTSQWLREHPSRVQFQKSTSKEWIYRSINVSKHTWWHSIIGVFPVSLNLRVCCFRSVTLAAANLLVCKYFQSSHVATRGRSVVESQYYFDRVHCVRVATDLSFHH